jgi:hypothetical protein
MNKSTKSLSGLLLIVLGMGLGYWAYKKSDSLESQINEFVSGSPTDEVMWLSICAAVSLIAGLFLFIKK